METKMSIGSVFKVSISDHDNKAGFCDNRNMVTSIHDKLRKPSKIYLKEWLDYRHLTAERLADRLDVNKGQISKLMSGKQRYNQDWLERIAFALNCEVQELYREPTAPTAAELLARMPPEVRERAMRVLIDFAELKTGT